MAVTPRVFCAVSAVITDKPYAPSAENAFRSAWMPAPPPESEPAMVRTLGIDWVMRFSGGGQQSLRGEARVGSGADGGNHRDPARSRSFDIGGVVQLDAADSHRRMERARTQRSEAVDTASRRCVRLGRCIEYRPHADVIDHRGERVGVIDLQRI